MSTRQLLGAASLVSEHYDISYLFGLASGSQLTFDQIVKYVVKQVMEAVKEVERSQANSRVLHKSDTM